jgi:hypothetical protein
MRTSHALLIALLSLPLPALAEEPDFFTATPYRWREDEEDKRLLKTRLAQAMAAPAVPKNAACARVMGSLLAAFAEAAPYFHKRDENFALFRVFTDPMTTPAFPAGDYLTHMLHRAMIDGKVPEEWLKIARELKVRTKAPIDLARLAYAVDGAQLIDSVYFNLPAFVQRYNLEVALAPSIAQDGAMDRFQDKYLDRDVSWFGLTLLDIHKEAPRKVKGVEVDDKPHFIATLALVQPQTQEDAMFGRRPPEPIRLRVTLAPEQYLDLKSVAVAGKYLVRGRIFKFQRGTGKPGSPPLEIDIRDALIFEDRDWTGYRGFATAEDVAACPEVCVNDLSPFGLKQQQGVGTRDGFGH